jgi:hypothetical protein
MKNIQSFEEFLNEAVRVETFLYKSSHSKEPRGIGLWYFSFTKNGSDSFSPETTMSYGDALKWAKEKAKKENKSTIYVMS